jgi:heme oxygenase
LKTSKKIFTNSELVGSLNYLMEVNDIESDIADLTNRVDNLTDVVDDDLGRMSYIRQLTAEFLDFLNTLNDELDGQVDIPNSIEKMNKIMGRSERKRYYMSKFRL